MNKLVIFDLDGVLIDSRELHYEALNQALAKVDSKYVISREEHLSVFDGLNTTKKLNLLSQLKGLPSKHYDDIWKDKQKSTLDLIANAPKNNSIEIIVGELKKRGWKIAVASNSIRETVRVALDALKILGEVDYYVSNEDVFNPKPFPEMYWKCMSTLKCLPKNTIIVEDSHIGREGALNSGGQMNTVKDT
jgi:HAD superfamily hydrolase (TIGR01509 family)